MAARVQPKGYMSSGLLTANSLVKSTPGRLGNLMMVTTATNTAMTVVLYDQIESDAANTDATVLAKAHLTSSDAFAHQSIPLPDVPFQLGCYAVNTNCEYIVHFS